MPNTKTIAGIQRGPDFEREVHEAHRVERVQREVKSDSKAEVNEPLIRAAVEAGKEVANTLGHTVDVKYNPDNEMVIMQVMSNDGKEVIRQIPAEEVIRTAEKIKKQQAHFLNSVM